MSDQIQETPQTEVNPEQVENTVSAENVAQAPAPQGKGGKFKAVAKDCYYNRHKRSICMLCICVLLILLATFFGSMIQTAGWKYTVEDLRNASNKSKVSIQATDKDSPDEYDVIGKVASGLLYLPKKADKDHQVPGIVLTHGLYNNREMQESNAIELVRRGFAVLAIDYTMHGHNTDSGSFGQDTFIDAAKYLYNLDCIRKDQIAVSGHSMGGSATAKALKYDGVDVPNLVASGKDEAGKTVYYPAGSHEVLKAGYNMGIISAGLVQANSAPTSLGSNVIAAGVLKASADEFFFQSYGATGYMKEKVYVKVSKTSVNEDNYTNYYVKKGNEYVKQTENDKFRSGQQYYNLSDAMTTSIYMDSKIAMGFVTGKGATDLAAMESWKVVNGGVYANGELLKEPANQKTWRTWDTESGAKIENTVPAKNKLVSSIMKGEALASTEQSIRVAYEAKETHPMNHFSIQSTAYMVDFFYNAFGTPVISQYKVASNQTWWLKEAFAIFGFVGLFGLMFPVLDLLLDTRLFASLKAKEGEIAKGPVLLTNPRKHVSYWLSGIATAIFAAFSLKNLYGADKWHIYNSLEKIFVGKEFIYNDTVAKFAIWGIVCAGFAVLITAVIWLINRAINIFVHSDDSASFDEHPFDGFKIRSWQNVLKTPILAAIILTVFYGVMNLIWKMSCVDFRFWTFDLRVFDLIRVPAMMQYVPFFFVFYMITSAMSQNYRVKDLPEWATVAINVVFNVIGVIILLWNSNSYFISTGAQIATSSLFYIAAIPIIPCVAFATVIARRMYTRTGNAWLAGIINAVIMTFIACANTSIVAAPVWNLGA